ncbi:MAG: peptidase S41, partial [Ferruginibacter sp.]
MRNWMIVFLMLLVYTGIQSCSVNKVAYSPNKKYPKEALQNDFKLLRTILEKKHPSLYWYTPKDSMAFYFDTFFALIRDSMNEQQFTWNVLAPMVDKIHCGHTAVSSSKAYRKWAVGKRLPSFPLYLKVWNDSMAVLANLNPKDSIFKRGTLVTSVNGIKNVDQINHFFNYLPEDGYANSVNYIRL